MWNETRDTHAHTTHTITLLILFLILFAHFIRSHHIPSTDLHGNNEILSNYAALIQIAILIAHVTGEIISLLYANRVGRRYFERGGQSHSISLLFSQSNDQI